MSRMSDQFGDPLMKNILFSAFEQLIFEVMRSKKLKNSPLKEAIFELSWQSPLDQTGFPLDKEFELVLGKFQSAIANDFPIYKRTIPANAPLKIYGRPIHQFWKGELKWPVVQLGPGILTVNDTDENYVWDPNYRQTIHSAILALTQSYNHQRSFNRLSLKYIDSVDISLVSEASKFVSENLQTNIMNGFEVPGELSGLNIHQVFSVSGSQIAITIQTAVNNSNGKPAIMWITSVEKNGSFSVENVLSWIDEAHTIASDLFVKMLNPKFYELFNQ